MFLHIALKVVKDKLLLQLIKQISIIISVFGHETSQIRN